MGQNTTYPIIYACFLNVFFHCKVIDALPSACTQSSFVELNFIYGIVQLVVKIQYRSAVNHLVDHGITKLRSLQRSRHCYKKLQFFLLT